MVIVVGLAVKSVLLPVKLVVQLGKLLVLVNALLHQFVKLRVQFCSLLLEVLNLPLERADFGLLCLGQLCLHLGELPLEGFNILLLLRDLVLDLCIVILLLLLKIHELIL